MVIDGHAYCVHLVERIGEDELGRLLRSPFAHEELAERGPFVVIDTPYPVACRVLLNQLVRKMLALFPPKEDFPLDVVSVKELED